jgi:UMF1 family MFS transporter
MATDIGAPATVEPVSSTRRERIGWYFYDWANSGFYTTVISVFLGPYLTAIAKNAAGCGDEGVSCDGRLLHPLGIPVAPGSFFFYMTVLATAAQVVVLPVAGAIADRSSHKKELLASFAYIGSGATICLLFLTGDRYLLGGGLFLLANLAFGASIVVYNSFLPQLAGPNDRDRVSSIGWAIGYIGGGLLLALNLVALLIGGEENRGLIARWSLVSAGVWWAGFTTVPLLLLRNRSAVAGEHRGGVLSDGFRQLGRTLRHLRDYKLTLLFLAAFLIYNDGVQTVIIASSTFASEELNLDEQVQSQTILMVQFVAFGGALLLGWIARTLGAWKTLLGSLLVWIVVVVLAYFLPEGKALWFMALGLLLGIVLGGSQALSRSLFSQLIPHGKEGEYFGLYEISDKGTSWLGPLLFGLAYQLTGSYRIAIFSVITFFVVGFIMLLSVPMRRAIVAAGNTPPDVL